MSTSPPTVEAYLSELPPDKREAIETIRKVILKNLPKGYEEGMQYGMIGYYVPHSVYPPGYHCDPKQPLPLASLAARKSHMSLSLMSCYGDTQEAAWLRDAWKKSGRKLDMGKACIRFKTLDDVPLDVVGQAFKRVPVKDYIAQVEAALASSTRGRKPAAKKTAKKVKKAQPQETTRKKVAPKATKKRASAKVVRK